MSHNVKHANIVMLDTVIPASTDVGLIFIIQI